MKVFISHSSRDKWIARRIAEDLEGLGAETFLDQKDIRTGQSIDVSIQDHLKESDEILMLLSPEALASMWVLIEIGGAKALGLRLIPILLHVGVNDLPPVLATGLARDLNDIENYYRELKQRLEGSARGELPDRASSRLEQPPEVPAPRRFEEGDMVVILPREQHRAERTDVGWGPPLDSYVGRSASVKLVDPDDGSVRLDIDSGRWWWAPDWLEAADGN